MEIEGGAHVVAEGGLDHLKRVQRTLRAQGIVSEITSPPPKHCSS